MDEKNSIPVYIQAYSLQQNILKPPEQLLKELLKQKPSFQQLNESLTVAVRADNFSIVAELVEAGAEPRSLDAPILYLAWQHAEKDNSRVFELLLEKGARITAEQQKIYEFESDFLSACKENASVSLDNPSSYTIP